MYVIHTFHTGIRCRKLIQDSIIFVKMATISEIMNDKLDHFVCHVSVDK